METARAYDEEARRRRAERILDVAADLLQRWGYKRLTMDDVANEAGVGKGTIYLHWKTREALFEAVLNREVVGVIDDLKRAVEVDPRNALPDRLGPIYFKTIMRRPLVHAVFRMDREVLGKLWQHERQREPQVEVLRLEYMNFLQDLGVQRTDVSGEELAYVFRTMLLGFFLADPLTGAGPSLERKAELLSLLIRGAMGIPEELSEEVVAAVAEHMQQLLTEASAAQLMAQVTRIRD